MASIPIITKIFSTMKTNQERVVKHFVFTSPKTLHFPGGCYQTTFATVIMLREKQHNTIKVLYRNDVEVFSFSSYEEKLIATEYLNGNGIMPAIQDFMDVLSTNKEIIRIINEAFQNLIMSKKSLAFVTRFGFEDFIMIKSPFWGNQHVKHVCITLIRKEDMNFIKVSYPDKRHEFLRFVSHEDHIFVTQFLHSNRIMPSPQAFLDSNIPITMLDEK